MGDCKRLLSSMYKVFGKLKFDQNEFAEFNNQTKTWSVA